VCFYNFVHSSLTETFRSLHKFLFPAFVPMQFSHFLLSKFLKIISSNHGLISFHSNISVVDILICSLTVSRAIIMSPIAHKFSVPANLFDTIGCYFPITYTYLASGDAVSPNHTFFFSILIQYVPTLPHYQTANSLTDSCPRNSDVKHN
jgi:hypothetical protein